MAADTNAPRPAAAWGLATIGRRRLRRHPASAPRPSLTRTPFCLSHPQGEIVEGSESEVRAGIFVVALTREVDSETGELCWRAAEVSFNAGTLFL